MYKIYADYGYISETLLESAFNSLDEAARWVDSYCGDGDFGGYNVIEIAHFVGDEYIVDRRYDADDYRRDDDYDPEQEY